jgi:hypothetical protein
MKKDTKRFIAYMLMQKQFKLIKVGKQWRIEFNGTILDPQDIEFLKLIAKKSGQKFDRLDKTVNPN